MPHKESDESRQGESPEQAQDSPLLASLLAMFEKGRSTEENNKLMREMLEYNNTFSELVEAYYYMLEKGFDQSSVRTVLDTVFLSRFKSLDRPTLLSELLESLDNRPDLDLNSDIIFVPLRRVAERELAEIENLFNEYKKLESDIAYDQKFPDEDRIEGLAELRYATLNTHLAKILDYDPRLLQMYENELLNNIRRQREQVRVTERNYAKFFRITQNGEHDEKSI